MKPWRDRPCANGLTRFSIVRRQTDVDAAAAEIRNALLATNATNSSVSKLYKDLMDPKGAFGLAAREWNKLFRRTRRKI